MPYSISTKDGIVINNIPDDVDRNSDALKEKVASTRAQRAQDEGVSEEVAEMRKGGSLERFGEGVSASFGTARRGVKGLFTDLSPEDKRQIAVNKAFLEGEKGEGIRAENLGAFATDVASFVVPGGAAIKAARGIPLAMKLASKAPVRAGVVGEAALGAGLSAAYAPEDRGTAAAFGGAGGAAGYGLGRALSRTLGGIAKPSKEAKQLMEQGVDVPIWKASENKLLRGAVERVKGLPVTKSFVTGQERGSLEGINKTWFSKATPPSPVLDEASGVLRWEMEDPITNIGAKGLQELTDKFDDAYTALYKGRVIPVDRAYGQEIGSIKQEVKNYFPRITKEFEAAVLQADDLLKEGTKGNEGVSPEALKIAVASVNKRIKGAWTRGEEELANALKELRNSLTDLRVRGLPPEVADMAKPINDAYVTFKQLQKAAGSTVVQREGIITPNRMLSAIKSTDITPNKSAFSKGSAANQPDVVTAAKVFDTELPNVGPGTAEKLLFPGMLLAPSILGADLGIGAGLAAMTSKSGQKFLLGGGSKQQAAAEALRRASPYFGLTGAYAGSELGQ